jgi:hypothetical protein
MLTQIAQTTSKYNLHHEGTKDTKDLGIYSLTPNFAPFAIFVVKTQGSTLVAALPRWAFVARFLLSLLRLCRGSMGALLFPCDSPTNRQMKIACAFAFMPGK